MATTQTEHPTRTPAGSFRARPLNLFEVEVTMALVLGWRALMNDCFVLEPSRRASATGRPAG